MFYLRKFNFTIDARVRLVAGLRSISLRSTKPGFASLGPFGRRSLPQLMSKCSIDVRDGDVFTHGFFKLFELASD